MKAPAGSSPRREAQAARPPPPRPQSAAEHLRQRVPGLGGGARLGEQPVAEGGDLGLVAPPFRIDRAR